ncbi:MAG: biotin/lipoyl-containing protein, partial [Marmoricola sp.]
AQQCAYTGAGTVEFLLDNASGEFYFLEMNTRLQVEHPVTEEVVRVRSASGSERVDLVELQLLVATGEPLPFDQDDVTLEGHAIEARVYAEDSWNGFLPQAGTAVIVHWPERARVDHALASGQVVSTSYDPMLGKVIVSGPDRESARRALVSALDDTAILGLTTNTGFLRALVASDEFRDATIDTAWLDHHELEQPSRDVARVFVAWVQALLVAQDTGHPFQSDGWRSGADPAPTIVELDETVRVDRARGLVGDYEVRELSAEQHVAVLAIDGRREQAVVNVQPHIAEVVHRGQRFVFDRPDVFAAHGPAAGAGTLSAPMPGTVLAVDVAEGDAVEEGQRLGVLEAMKMELALKAPFTGTVTTVGAKTADQVALGQVLFVVEED